MKIKVKVVEQRGGGSRFVQLADEPTTNLIEEINRSVTERELWLPDGSELYTSQSEEQCVKVPDGSRYLLSEAYDVFGKYGN